MSEGHLHLHESFGQVTETTNPWIVQVPEPKLSPADTGTYVPLPTGPITPQRGVSAPPLAEQLPLLTKTYQAQLWVMGVHGGAGESSLASLVAQWQPAEHGWPQQPGGIPSQVILTARTHIRGLRAVQAAARQWASGGVPGVEVLGLVLVPDAPGRLPRTLRDFAKLVSGGLPRTWTLPWIEDWRLEEPHLDNSPRQVKKFVDEVQALLKTV